MNAITPILSALNSGYEIPDILNFIENGFPGLSPRIKKAKSTGYTANQILKLIHRGMGGGEELDHLTESQIHTRKDQQQNQFAQDIYKTLAASGVGAGVARGLPRIAKGVKEAFGGAMTSGPPAQPSLSQPQTNIQSSLSLDQKAILSPQQRNTTTDQLSPKQFVPTNPPSPPSFRDQFNQNTKQRAQDIIKQLGIEKTIKNVSTSNKKLEDMASDVINSLSPEQKETYERLKDQGGSPPMISLLKDYFGKWGEESSFSASGKESAEPSSSPISKGALVLSPWGIGGEIKSIRNGKALVEDNGKLHQLDEDDLIQSPIPEKDLADLHADLIGGIEKETGEDVSRMVDFAGYNPNTNSLAFLPHTGALYIYDDISPEDVQLLTNILNVRKTSGENFIGTWKAGTKSPIGAAMSQLIQRLQKESGGKGKEYSGKFDTVYKALEPALLAAKKKKKKKR